MRTYFIKLLGLLFCIGAMMVPFPSQQANSYRTEISGAATIGDEWLELHPKHPLRADKDIQMIFLDLELPLRDDLHGEGRAPNTRKGILMPDGGVVNPEIEVIDQNGNTFKLVYSGSIGIKPTYDLPYPDNWPRDRVYTTVRIRSQRPIKCKAIFWFCESLKDKP